MYLESPRSLLVDYISNMVPIDYAYLLFRYLGSHHLALWALVTMGFFFSFSDSSHGRTLAHIILTI